MAVSTCWCFTLIFAAIFLAGVDCRNRINKATYRSKKIGEGCKLRSDCHPAFAVCINSTCQCPEGFQVVKGKCVTTLFSCPVGDPIMNKNGKIDRCTRRLLPKPPSNTTSTTVLPGLDIPQWEDSCGTDKLCVPESQDASVYPSAWYGHCCLLPKAVCPVGVPSSQRCDLPYSFELEASAIREKLSCNTSTHYCLSTTINSVELGTICCPRACLDVEVFANGLCYPRVRPGGNCELDEQCINGECKQDVCVCRKTDVLVDNYCTTPSCDDSGTFYGREAKYLKPLTTKNGSVMLCGSKDRSDCPSDAYCSVKYAVCCPKPPLSCQQPQSWYFVPYGQTTTTTTEAPILPETYRCEPIPTKLTCGKRDLCKLQFSHLRNDGSIGMFGVCCTEHDFNNHLGFQSNIQGIGGANNIQQPNSNAATDQQQSQNQLQNNIGQQGNRAGNDVWQNWQGSKGNTI